MSISRKLVTSCIGVLLVAVIIFNVFSVIVAQKDKYATFNFWQNYPSLKQSYLDSQYVNKKPKKWIPDEAVNAYAGAEYVKGVLPILIAPDTPPLGRYIIGLSGFLFNNVNIQNLFFVIGSLVMLYKVGQQVFQNRILSLLPVYFVSLEPIFLNQIVYTPLLDIMQLFFLLCSFYFFNLIFIKKQNPWFSLLAANFFLGCFIATKFYVTGITIVAAWMGTLLLLRRLKDMFRLMITLPVAVIVLLTSYIRVLFDNYPFLPFLGIQKYVFLYHKSQLIHPFSIWPLLLFNQWYVWFGDKPVISDAQWRVTWFLTTVLSVFSSILLFLKTTKVTVIPLLLWILAYLSFFSLGQVAPRYLIILIPVMYIVSLYFVREVILFVVKRKRI